MAAGDLGGCALAAGQQQGDVAVGYREHRGDGLPQGRSRLDRGAGAGPGGLREAGVHNRPLVEGGVAGGRGLVDGGGGVGGGGVVGGRGLGDGGGGVGGGRRRSLTRRSSRWWRRSRSVWTITS